MTNETTSDLYARLAAWERDGKAVLPGLREPCHVQHRFGPAEATCEDAGCPGYTVVEDMPMLLVALREAGFLSWLAIEPPHGWSASVYQLEPFAEHAKTDRDDPQCALLLAAVSVMEAEA